MMSSLVIIGGSDAGVSAALRARETDPALTVEMLVADAYPNYSICGLPFYLSGEVSDWRRLAHRSLPEIEQAGIRVHLNTRALRIDPPRHTVLIAQAGRATAAMRYDRLVIATGAEPVRPPIQGLEFPGVFLLHTMEDSFAVATFINARNPRSVLIVGAGYIGLEMAEALTRRGLAVTLVEQRQTVLPTVDPAFGERLRTYLHDQGVKVKTDVTIQEIKPLGDSFEVIGTSGFRQETEMVLVVVGVKPVTKLAEEAGITLGFGRAIEVDRAMATNQPDIWAAGDCAETYHRLLKAKTYLPLGTTAHKQGRIAGENAAGGRLEFSGSLGTQVVKVFDRVVARTGLRDQEAKAAGYRPLTQELTTWDHKAYYPGAHEVTVRITGDKDTGQFLGAQIMGHWQGAIAKRIDIFAMALYQEMTVAELLAVDLSYTPPLGSPWDPVQMAADRWMKRVREG